MVEQMPHFYQFYENFLNNEKRLNIKSATEQLKQPTLIIHGDMDTSVNIKEAFNIHKWHNNSIQEIIENADHVFNTHHPWDDNSVSSELNKVISASISFLKS